MKVQKNQNVSFNANIIHKYGAKKQMIESINQFWQEVHGLPEDFVSEKKYADKIMNRVPFNAKYFYNKTIKNFRD